MLPSVESAPLMGWLKEANPRYHSRLLDLRDACKAVLAYVPATFAHYTQHTIEHSDELVRQLSNLLVGSAGVPVVELSGAEAYIMIASAYLHDTGMVVSKTEQATVIGSDEWKDWVQSKPNLTLPSWPLSSWSDVVTYEHALAEYFRERHAQRSGQLVLSDHHELRKVLLDDEDVVKAVAAVCEAHGLSQTDLRDSSAFPDERYIAAEKVNLAFCAILLRLADLLDLRKARAGAMLKRCAGGLSPSSQPHWEQYGAITHVNVTPELIEITAECEKAEQYRSLKDWCQWIVDETEAAQVTKGRWRRHANWKPPAASMTQQATIQISPSPTATFKTFEWRFELDDIGFVQSIISSFTGSTLHVLRELLKNALDATRAAKEEDESSHSSGGSPNHSINIDLIQTGSGSVLTIDDCGIGMNADTISQFFLKLGKSVVHSPTFKKKYKFYPSGQFGFGFVSVFAMSSRVTIDTWTGHASDEKLTLNLFGPRNYLLVETGARDKRGTRITLELDNTYRFDALEIELRNLHGFIEFPITLSEGNQLRVTVAPRLPLAEHTAYDIQVPIPIA